MEIDRKELKRRAREAMRGASPRPWLVALVFILLTTGLSALIGLLLPIGTGSGAGLFATILFALWSSVIGFGFTLWALWTWRKLDPDLGALFQGFSVAGRVVVMDLLIALRVLGWTMLFSIGYAFLLPVLTGLFTPLMMVFPTAGILLTTLLAVVPIYAFLIPIMLRYAMAPYLLADQPDSGVSFAIQRSVEMMRGRKWDLFKLHFSFWPWYAAGFVLTLTSVLAVLAAQGLFPFTQQLLIDQNQQILLAIQGPAVVLGSVLTLPIDLWLAPYLRVAQAAWYDTVLHLPSPFHQSDEMPPL